MELLSLVQKPTRRRKRALWNHPVRQKPDHHVHLLRSQRVECDRGPFLKGGLELLAALQLRCPPNAVVDRRWCEPSPKTSESARRLRVDCARRREEGLLQRERRRQPRRDHMRRPVERAVEDPPNLCRRREVDVLPDRVVAFRNDQPLVPAGLRSRDPSPTNPEQLERYRLAVAHDAAALNEPPPRDPS